MAVNKNFVVKNGLEVSSDLIFADSSTNKVGIGSTIPSRELDIIGGIGATNINLTGVGTIPTLKGTTGIVSTIVAHSAQIDNINVTGITSIGDISPSNLYVTGVTTTATLDVIGTGNMRVGIITEAQGTNLNFAGISTLGVTTTTDLTAQKFNVSGISTINNLIITPDDVGTGSTIGAAVGVITYIGDGSQLTGLGIGIGSTGSNGLGASGLVGYGFTQLNFIGLGVSDVLFNTSAGIATVWIEGGGGGSGNVSIGSDAPTSPSNGDLWYSTEYGTTFIWFDEVALGIGNTAVWVDSSPFNQGGKFLSKYGDNAYGAIGYTGGTTSQASIYYTTDPNTGIYFPATDKVGVTAGGVGVATFNANGFEVAGIVTAGSFVGDGSGLTGVASTDNIITTTEAKLLGGVRMEGFTTSATMNVTGISTFRNDMTITGSQAGVTSVFWDASADTLTFQDLSYAKFGAGGDLSIYHDGSNSYIDDAGELRIRGTYVKIRGANDEDGLIFTQNGSIQLKYDNSTKIETDLHGTITTGVSTADGFSVGDNEKFIAGNSSDLHIYHESSGNDSYIDNNKNKLYIRNNVDGDDGGDIVIQAKSGEDSIRAIHDAAVELRYDGSRKFQTSGIGVTVEGTMVSTAATIGTGVTINNTGIDAGIGAGIVTASSFVGDLTGDVTGNVTGNCSGSSGSCTGNAASADTVDTTSSNNDATHYLVYVDSSGTQSGETLRTYTNLKANPSSGTITATEFVGGGAGLTGIAAGGSGEFNTSISGATQYDVTTSMATAYTANASASHRTIVHSIHICNISTSEITISGEIQSSFSLAHTIPVPAGSAVELLKQPKVLGPSETIELQASANSSLEATIVVEYKEDTDYWDAQVDITSSATMTDIYTSSSNPSVVQSILLANDDGTADVKARVAWTDGSNNIQSYLCYDMVIPADSTVELCEKPKYLASGYKLRGYANQADRLEITASGKQITS